MYIHNYIVGYVVEAEVVVDGVFDIVYYMTK